MNTRGWPDLIEANGLKRWIVELKVGRVQASVGFGIGLLVGAFAKYLNQLPVRGNPPQDPVTAFESNHSIIDALGMVALYLLFLHRYKITHKNGEVFVLSCFGGIFTMCLIYSIFQVLGR